MKILVFSWRGPGHPHAGGAEESTHQHAKGWVKAGHNVTLFTSTFKNGKEREMIDGVEIIRKGEQVFGVHLAACWWYLFSKHQRFELVIDQFHGIPFFTPLYIRAKKVAFIHEVTKEVWKLNPWLWPLNLLPAFLGTFFEPLIFKLFYKRIPFMTVSESTRDDLVSWDIPKDNIKVVYNGVKVINFEKVIHKNSKRTLIFLGALSKDKGVEDSIEIFFDICKTDTNDWQMWIVGKGNSDYVQKLMHKAMDLGITKKIKFWGFVSENKKFELLAKSHILINTSTREGWGLVVIEAGVMGTPTVGYKVAGLKDSIVNGKTGLLFDKKDRDKMAEAIVDLVSNQKEYLQFSKNAQFRSRSFDWNKSTKESLALIERLAVEIS